MNVRTVFGLLVVVGTIAFVGGRAVSDDKQPPPGMEMPSPEEMKAMMERHHAATTLGEAHRRLEHFVGRWGIDGKIYMGGPTMPPTPMKGSTESKWVLGRHFIAEEGQFEITMPNPANPAAMTTMSYSGRGLFGYDNFKKMYVGTWADSINTHLLTMRGNCDPSGKVFTYYGEMDEPSLGVANRMVKYVTRIINENKHVFEAYDLHAGDDYKVLEFVYQYQ